jgi:hypothetical protein
MNTLSYPERHIIKRLKKLFLIDGVSNIHIASKFSKRPIIPTKEYKNVFNHQENVEIVSRCASERATSHSTIVWLCIFVARLDTVQLGNWN